MKRSLFIAMVVAIIFSGTACAALYTGSWSLNSGTWTDSPPYTRSIIDAHNINRQAMQYISGTMLQWKGYGVIEDSSFNVTMQSKTSNILFKIHLPPPNPAILGDDLDINVIPMPSTLFIFGSGIFGLLAIRRKLS